jgi:hypothetical protein
VSEIEQLKQRIIDSAYDGVETAHIRDDYEPIGQGMISDLCTSGKFWTQREVGRFGVWDGPWKIWAIEFKPR